MNEVLQFLEKLHGNKN